VQTAFGGLKVIRIDCGIAQSKAMLILDILDIWFHHDDSVEPLQIVESDDCTSHAVYE
jgi:hypothetical protein